MDSGQDRLLQFELRFVKGKNICSSEGIFVNFPPSLKKPFQMKGLGLIICPQGNFQFSLNQKKHFAGAGESLFIPEDGEFQVLQESEDMEGTDFDLSDRTDPGYYGESGCFHVYVFPPYSRRTFLCMVYW